jgi:phosphate starvation-inducible protein PhoH and related proteins
VDVVRHPLVQEVVRAYEAWDAERQARTDAAKADRAGRVDRAGALPSEAGERTGGDRTR